MTSRSGKLGDFVMTLFLLGIGGTMIYGAAINPEVGKTIAGIIEIPLASGLLGAALILSVALRWVGGCGKKKDSFIDFQSDDGTVGISTKAIQDFIERVGKEFAAVKSIESRLIQDKGALDIAMSVKVVSGNKIPELSKVLQHRIRESVKDSLGLEEIRKITIKVQEIVGDPAKSADSEPAQE